MTKPLAPPDPASLLASLTRNVPGAIYRCNLDGDWTMHLIGDEIERISGYPAADFIEHRERTYSSIIHPDDRPRVEAQAREGARSDATFELEYRIVHDDGDARWVLERGQRTIDANGDGWLDGIIFDITARRQFEELARQSEAEAARLA